MKTFIICNKQETERQANIAKLLKQLPSAQLVNAVYPSQTHVPFLREMMEVSKKRTGKALLPAEIGCLLSHRMVWRNIVANADKDAANDEANDEEYFLILESDSMVRDIALLHESAQVHLPQYDIFFFGAWLGNMQLFRSSKIKWGQYSIGVPFIKTVYCTYGYAVNKKAAAYLLKQTVQLAHPVDQFKYFVNSNALKMGGIMPELIAAGTLGTYINQNKLLNWQRALWMKLLYIKNYFICLLR
ncbi:MAG: glycosyltransferase family 25 protein [Sediminibacterium sp.]|nr:glycosyltransferase family 25 protein [Sediminibacterium sp.]